MGEAQNQPFQLSFNPALRVEFQGSRVTSDGGLIFVRELDERSGFSALIAYHLTDPRGKNTQFSLADLVRQSVYSRLAGYEDVNDAERLSQDPTFWLIGSEQIWDQKKEPGSTEKRMQVPNWKSQLGGCNPRDRFTLFHPDEAGGYRAPTERRDRGMGSQRKSPARA